MVLPSELDSQGHHHASHVTAAVDGMAPRHGDQRIDGVGLFGTEPAHLGIPGLLDPLHHRQRQVFLVGEQAVQRAACVARLVGYPLQRQGPTQKEGSLPRPLSG